MCVYKHIRTLCSVRTLVSEATNPYFRLPLPQPPRLSQHPQPPQRPRPLNISPARGFKVFHVLTSSLMLPEGQVAKIKALCLASILVDDGPGVVHDLDEAARRLTLDVMGFSKLGYDFKAVESEGEVLMLRLFEEVAAEWDARRRRLFGRLAPWVSDGAAEGLTRCRILQHFIEKVLWENISARGPPPADDVTLAAQLARLRSPPVRGDPALTHERTLSELAAQLLMSHGPTGHAIAWALGCVAANRGTQDKLVAELKREGVFDDPLCLTYDMLPKLPYLDCVIRETLRLYPPMPCPATVRTIKKDVVLASGHHLPAGSEVWVDVFSMHRSPRLWRDANRFNPERWATTTTTTTEILEHRKEKQYDGLCTVEPDADAEIDPHESDAGGAKTASQASKEVSEPEAVAAAVAGCHTEEERQQQPPKPAVVAPLCNPAAYMPFGAGPRSCLGQRLAVAEVKAVVSVLLCFLSFEPSCGEEDVPQPASSSAGSEVFARRAEATVAAVGAPAGGIGGSDREFQSMAGAGREEVAPLGLGLFLRPVGGMRLLVAPRKRK
ncbi:hypothetical protein Vafri_13526 [Volvox africanus]|nr:hypothetical protein Vafri_13526 [Volvox africanus]